MDKNEKWVWPESSRRLARYKKINKYYKESFQNLLKQGLETGKIKYHLTYEELSNGIGRSNWVVNNTWPTENTEVIENYLAKYINRSAVSKKRLHYDSSQRIVELTCKDYYNQVEGEPAPYVVKKIDPLLAIHQIVQHKLPPGLHRVRYYGLHHNAIERKVKSKIKPSLLRNKDSVQILFELLTKMLNQTKKSPKRVCSKCGSDKFDIEKVSGDPKWIYKNIVDYSSSKSPPNKRGMI